MILAYTRVSTDKQTVKNQRDEINRYAVEHKMIIDEFIEVEMSSRKSESKRRITELLEKVSEGDIIITSELSRLGRSTQEVLKLIDILIKKKIEIIFIKQALHVKSDKQDMTTKVMLTMFSLFAELERDLISSRTKEALASRKGKGVLGHKTGTVLKSKYDKDHLKLIELFNLGLSAQKIIDIHLERGTAKTLKTWRDKRYEWNGLLKEWTAKESFKKFLIDKGI